MRVHWHTDSVPGMRKLCLCVRLVVLSGLLSVASAVPVAAHADGSTRSPTAAASRCARPQSTTLLETGKVRLYAMPEDSTASGRDPSIAGRPVFGCLTGSGRSVALDRPEVQAGLHAYWVEVDPRALAANGPLIAYSFTEYYLDTHLTWVRVRNLRTGSFVRTCAAGGGMAPHRGTRVTDIVLHSDGEVAWNVEGEGSVSLEDQEPGCDQLP